MQIVTPIGTSYIYRTSTACLRQTVANWFQRHSNHEKGYIGFCSIFNDGQNLYIQNSQYPGQFSTIPYTLFSHDVGVIKAGGMQIIHRGYTRPEDSAKVLIVDGRGGMYNLTIDPGHLAHAVHKTMWVVTRSDYMPVQSRFLRKYTPPFTPIPVLGRSVPGYDQVSHGM